MSRHFLDNKEDIQCQLLDVNFDPDDGRWHILTCRNLETGRKFKIAGKYDYLYQILATSPSLDISYWSDTPFRELLNRMIFYQTPLICKVSDSAEGGFILKNSNSNDPFFTWVARHNRRQKHPDWVYNSDDSEFEMDDYEIEWDHDHIYPNYDTNSEESCDDLT